MIINFLFQKPHCVKQLQIFYLLSICRLNRPWVPALVFSQAEGIGIAASHPHRFAANTKLNTESSRSHAILMLHVKRNVKGRGSTIYSENGTSHLAKSLKAPIIRRSKLVVVDLAGSERIDKSGEVAESLCNKYQSFIDFIPF
nr:armadillo repeat-containing kinesin-like protein 2 [Ipomoea batatas]